ncbi:hypothetical protein ACFL4G_10250 [Thermodesulfobacteriota bacterium]
MKSKLLFLSLIVPLALMLISAGPLYKDWGPWHTLKCLPGIDARVKCDTYNELYGQYRWRIEFRNRYKKKVHFSYDLLEVNDPPDTHGRKHLDPGEIGSSYTWVNTPPSKNMKVFIDEVCFDSNDNCWNPNVGYAKPECSPHLPQAIK